VVLGGENEILGTGIFHYVSPFVRIHIHWVELISQREIPLLICEIIHFPLDSTCRQTSGLPTTSAF
jgi:hypothetical protein